MTVISTSTNVVTSKAQHEDSWDITANGFGNTLEWVNRVNNDFIFAKYSFKVFISVPRSI